jgi:cell division protein FtsX
MTLTTICGLATLVVGLLLGYTSILRYRAASGMIFGDSNNRDLGIDRDAVESLTARIKDGLGPVQSQYLLGSFGFIDVPARVLLPQSDQSLPARGRTAHQSDPGLERTIKLSKGRFPLPQEVGMIVSPAFIEQFGDEPIVEFAQLGHQASGRIPVPILGVTTREFSKYWTFLMLEPSYNEIQAKYQKVDSTWAKAAPIPEGWKKLNHPRGIINVQRKWGISEQTRDGEFLTFKSDKPRDYFEWQEFFAELRSKISGTGPISNDASFTNVQQMESPDSQKTSSEEWSLNRYDYVSIYTRAPQDIEQIVRFAKPMPADPVFMATLEQIGDVSQLASLVQTVVFVCITVLGAVVFFAIQALRAETKRSDLGLLKSLGLSSRQLGLLFLIEGGVLWLGSQVASLVVLPVGYYLSLLMVQSNDELALSFPWLYPLLLSAALSLGVCLGACWLGTSQVRKLSPVMLFPAN